jgi:pantoate--beta-alanine ligase
VQVINTIQGLREARAGLKGQVGLVPTMGALHAGHLSLVEQARADNDSVMVTIFVNPTQFAPNEDLAAYPRDLPRDLEMLRASGVDLVFTPTPELIYPPGFQTYVEVTQVSQGLEGERRPGHFRGVATVVAKLFNLTQPDNAYFGQKDAQQVVVLRRMASDLNFPLKIVVCLTQREADGLAMSSRNVYLSTEQRKAAGILYKALSAAGEAYTNGEREPKVLHQRMLDVLCSETLAEVEYISIADPQTLTELEIAVSTPILVSLVVRIGKTRLLDNCLLPMLLNSREDLTRILGAV